MPSDRPARPETGGGARRPGAGRDASREAAARTLRAPAREADDRGAQAAAVHRPGRDPRGRARGARRLLRLVAAGLPPAALAHRRSQGTDRRATGQHRRARGREGPLAGRRATCGSRRAKRFGYLMPGETSYVVLDEHGNPIEPETELTDPDSVGAEASGRGLHRRVGVGEARRQPARAGAAAAERDRRLEGPRRPVIDPADEETVAQQLGRPPRSIHAVGHRCPCGNPDVVTTEPRLPNGTPFPTTFYLTCPRAASLIGTLEGSGLMKEMQARLGEDPELAGGLPGRPRVLPRLPLDPRRGARDRGDHGRRHARPGQVPARARRPRAGRRAGREPAR